MLSLSGKMRPADTPEQFLGVEIDHRLTANQRGLIGANSIMFHDDSLVLARKPIHINTPQMSMNSSTSCPNEPGQRIAACSNCPCCKQTTKHFVHKGVPIQFSSSKNLFQNWIMNSTENSLNWKLRQEVHCALNQNKATTIQLHQSGTDPSTNCELEHKLSTPL